MQDEELKTRFQAGPQLTALLRAALQMSLELAQCPVVAPCLSTCFMSLLRPPPENFYPRVNLDFTGHPTPSLVDGTWKNSELWPYCRFWDMNKYEGNMKNYEEGMKK